MEKGGGGERRKIVPDISSWNRKEWLAGAPESQQINATQEMHPL